MDAVNAIFEVVHVVWLVLAFAVVFYNLMQMESSRDNDDKRWRALSNVLLIIVLMLAWK